MDGRDVGGADSGPRLFLAATLLLRSTSGQPDEGNVSNLTHAEPTMTDQPLQRSPLEALLVGLVITLIIVATLVGNILVVAAVANFHRLRTVTNCFVVSLAIADILVAFLVMPLGLLYEVYGYWRFGWIFCYFWMSCDVTCCTASILHLCVISLDRYLAITQPLTYKSKMTRKRACLMIAIVWMCSISISFVPVYLGWFANTDAILYRDEPECAGLSSVNRVYAVISSTTSFYAPLIVMVFTYMRIFTIAQKQANEIRKLETSIGHLKNSKNIERRSQRISRDNKAIKTLGILMGLFCFCWVPFFVMYVVMPFCDTCELSTPVLAAITWLGYVNSCINPCVYAFLNRDFRTAFRKILCCARCCMLCRGRMRTFYREKSRKGSALHSSLVIENRRSPSGLSACTVDGKRTVSMELQEMTGNGRKPSGCRSTSISSSSEYRTQPLIARVQ